MYIPSKNISWQTIVNEIYILDKKMDKNLISYSFFA